jgi:hypothetical protein
MDSNNNFDNQPPNSVRLSHIIKNTGKDNVCRHLDTILQAATERVGPIQHMHIYKLNHSNARNQIDTIGHIMLKNPSKHQELVFLLHGINFHGKPLQACFGNHHFSTIDDSYTPRTIKCNQCAEFVDYVPDKELVKQQALYDKINTAPIHKPIINSKSTVNQTIQPQSAISTINTSIGRGKLFLQQVAASARSSSSTLSNASSSTDVNKKVFQHKQNYVESDDDSYTIISTDSKQT